ncbi:MAG: HlyD family efflux transporter periplasmic adaptor subunit [Lentisphaeraceae bacterium]|nr:HlyD family efflux transporter periplasmic adaptor subunit [Lentisphaeraceae bacterium]
MSIFANATSNTRQPRHFGIFLIPLILIILLVGVFAWSSRDAFLSQGKVEVAPVRMISGQAIANEQGTLFQAAGWTEAAPYPISVTALVSGIVDKIFIVSGQDVKKGQILATLIDDDLLLKQQENHVQTSILKAQLNSKLAKVKAAQADIELLAYQRKTAQTKQKRLQNIADTFNAAGDAAILLERQQSTLEVEEQKQRVAEFSARHKVLAAALAISNAAAAEIEQKIELQKVAQAKIKLDISRLTIKAPVNGRIQHLFAREGRKQMLNSDKETSTTVALMYDPREMQIRVDVPLSDVAQISIGQKAKITMEINKLPLSGEVTSISGHADFQKNTLEVKVRINAPLDLLRPEMLAQVEFLSNKSKDSIEVQDLLVAHKDCISNNAAWVVNPESKLEKRMLETGSTIDGWIQIKSGLSAGEKLVLNPASYSLSEGRKVKVGNLHE